MKKHRYGPQGCAKPCSADHVPFPAVENAVCGPDAAAEPPHAEQQWGLRQLAESSPSQPANPHLHGGQWLIPEVQTDATGLVCDWEH
eukprot:COSAG05_NODE_23232_length_259_cov_0.650000_1_plen_86_part_11